MNICVTILFTVLLVLVIFHSHADANNVKGQRAAEGQWRRNELQEISDILRRNKRHSVAKEGQLRLKRNKRHGFNFGGQGQGGGGREGKFDMNLADKRNE